MKLESVAVKLTQKNIGKVYDILKMFGEDIYSETKQRLENSMLSDVFDFIHFSDAKHWTGLTGSTEKLLIKPSKLKQLLAKERLKGGDVVIVDNNKDGLGSRWILDLTGNNISNFEHSNSYNLIENEIDFDIDLGNDVVDGKFIRFATEEEKALLNSKPEKKELEVGKWYKYTDSNNEYSLPIIANFQGVEEDSNYGFDFLGKWCEDITLYHYKLGGDITEATRKEVEQALIKEAKKRNIIEGYHITDLNNVSIVPNGEYVYSNGTLYFGGATIFKDGKWAEIIESTKIEPGNWYKNENRLIYSVDDLSGYGIVNGNWVENSQLNGSGWNKLSLEDTHKELLEFIKKFYSIGDVVECLKVKDICKITEYIHFLPYVATQDGEFWCMSGDLGICLMTEGKFARKLQKVGV